MLPSTYALTTTLVLTSLPLALLATLVKDDPQWITIHGIFRGIPYSTVPADATVMIVLPNLSLPIGAVMHCYHRVLKLTSLWPVREVFA
jgi:hypothetical protein